MPVSTPSPVLDGVDAAIALNVGDVFTLRGRTFTAYDAAGTYFHAVKDVDAVTFKVWNASGNVVWVTVKATDTLEIGA